MAAGVARSQLGGPPGSVPGSVPGEQPGQISQRPPVVRRADFGSTLRGESGPNVGSEAFADLGSASSGRSNLNPTLEDPADLGSALSEESGPNAGSDAFEAVPAPLTVLGADGQPEEGALVHAFDGRPIRLISDGTEVVRFRRAGTAASSPVNTAEPIDHVTDDAGRFRTTHPLLLIEGESGYGVTSLSEMKQHPSRSVRLIAWKSLSGLVSVNQSPLTDVRVYAYWESFPHLPELTRQSPDKALQGPVMASYQTSAAVDRTGQFELKKVPLGRVRLCVGGPLNKHGEPTWMSNLVWWTTVDSSHKDTIPVQNFDAYRIDGSVTMSDELLAARTQVVSQSGRAVISSLPVALRFHVAEPADDYSAEPLPVPRPDPRKLSELMTRAVIWARPGGERESQPSAAKAEIDAAGRYVCYLQKADYDVGLMLQRKTPKDSEPQWAMINSPIAHISNPRDDAEVHMEDIVVPTQPFAMPNTDLTPVDEVAAAEDFDIHFGDDFSDDLASDFREPVADEGWGPVPDVRNEPQFGPARVEDGFAERDALRDFGSSDEWSEPGFTPPGATRAREFSPDFGDRESGRPPRSNPTSMLQNPRQSEPTNSPLEASIASLVTDILAAGDRRTRQQLKQPLKDLLLKKFDAEQQAREALVAQLTRRLAAASKQVQDRAAGRERIVNAQLQRILGLPEDAFDLLAEPQDDGEQPPLDTTRRPSPDPADEVPFVDSLLLQPFSGDQVLDESIPVMPADEELLSSDRVVDPPAVDPSVVDPSVEDTLVPDATSGGAFSPADPSRPPGFRPERPVDRTSPENSPTSGGDVTREPVPIEDLSPPPAFSDPAVPSAD